MSFQNDGQFPVSHESLAGILSRYNVEDFEYSVATSGIENTTCIIEVPGKKFALRVYRLAKKPLAAIEHEIMFMQELQDRGLPIPAVFLNKSKEVITQITLDGKKWEALLMEYMSGAHPKKYEIALLTQMAQAQATMHLMSVELIVPRGLQPELTELVEGEFVRRIDRSKITDGRLIKYIDRIADYTVKLPSELPCGYSHFDFDMGNILVDEQNNLLAILDFDDLQYAPLVICLGYTLWSILYETGNEELVVQYLAKYQKQRPLTKLEKEYLPKIVLFRHYVITALRILNGHVSSEDVEHYENLEKQIGGFDLGRMR